MALKRMAKEPKTPSGKTVDHSIELIRARPEHHSLDAGIQERLEEISERICVLGVPSEQELRQRTQKAVRKLRLDFKAHLDAFSIRTSKEIAENPDAYTYHGFQNLLSWTFREGNDRTITELRKPHSDDKLPTPKFEAIKTSSDRGEYGPVYEMFKSYESNGEFADGLLLADLESYLTYETMCRVLEWD